VRTSFKFARLKTDKTRFLAHCAARGCPWHIHASTIYDKKTIKVICFDLFLTCFWTIFMFLQIKKLPAEHNYPTTKLREENMASQG
jgi:hypothetical protein